MKIYRPALLFCTLLSCANAADPAQSAYYRGDFAQALELWQHSEASPTVTVQMADAYQRLGFYDQAETVLHRLSSDELPPADQALAWHARAALALARGQYAQAATAQEHALRAARQAGKPVLLAKVFNQQGNLANLELDYARAEQAYAEALAYLAKSPDPYLAAKIHLNRLRNFSAWPAAQAAQIQTAWQTARQAWQALEPGYAQVMAFIYLGETAPTAQAESLLQPAVAIAAQLGNPVAKAQAAAAFGQWQMAQGDLAEALSLTRQAVFFARQAPQTALLYLHYRQLGAILQRQGLNTEALAAYREAIRQLQKQWDREAYLGYRDTYEGFRRYVEPVYLEFVELLLHQAKSLPRNPTRQALLHEAVRAVEGFKRVELEDYFQTPCKSFDTQACPLLSRALPAGTAVVYPLMFKHHLALVLKIGERLDLFEQAVDRETLRTEVAMFSALLRAGGAGQRGAEKTQATEVFTCAAVNRSGKGRINPFLDIHALQNSARHLYERLFAPLETRLQQAGIDTLVVVPDGILRTLPFSALHDGSRYLVQRYAGVVSPGLCLSAAGARDTLPKPLLLGGLSLAVEEFSALQCVEYELQAVQSLYPRQASDLLLNTDFTLATLQSAWGGKPYSALHIASHGQFSTNPANTFLLTYDGKLSLNALAALVRRQTGRGQAVDLLTLSACETAVGNDRAALGLAGVAVKAGARSALASLWRIDDQITPAVIVEFYRQLHSNGQNKARALQQAQRRLLEDPRYPIYRHPYYWAAFLLIGGY